MGKLARIASILSLVFLIGCATSKKEIAITVPSKIDGSISSMTVHDFDGVKTHYATTLRRELINQLTSAGYIKVLDRGAEAIITGSVQLGRVERSYHNSQSTYTKKVNGKKREYQVTNYHVTKKQTASVNFEVNRSGETLGSDSYSVDYENQWTGDSRGEADARAETDEQIFADQLRSMAQYVSNYVSPHSESISLKLMDGSKWGTGISKHPGLSTGIKYFESARYDQAGSLWQQVVEKEPDTKLVAMAQYNLGVIEMVHNKYDDAFEKFATADGLDPGNKSYITALGKAEVAGGQKKQVDKDWVESVQEAQLTVSTDPQSATVRIMDIAPKYKPGMSVSNGSHRIKVLSPGYITHDKWYSLDTGVNNLHIQLKRQ